MALLKIIMAICMATAGIGSGLLSQSAVAAEQPFPLEKLLIVGAPGPTAAGIRAWIHAQSGQELHESGSVILSVQANSDSHVAAILVSPGRDVTVLFPNKEHPDSSIGKDTVYSFFGKNSRLGLVVGKRVTEPQLAVYVSSKPLALDGFTFSEKTGLITIPAHASDELTALKRSIESITGDKGFNRVMVSTDGKPNQYYEILVKRSPSRLMGGPRPVHKKLPTSVESQPPDTVTGVQGLREDKHE